MATEESGEHDFYEIISFLTFLRSFISKEDLLREI